MNAIYTCVGCDMTCSREDPSWDDLVRMIDAYCPYAGCRTAWVLDDGGSDFSVIHSPSSKDGLEEFVEAYVSALHRKETKAAVESGAYDELIISLMDIGWSCETIAGVLGVDPGDVTVVGDRLDHTVIEGGELHE